MRRIESGVQALRPRLLRGEKVDVSGTAVEHPSCCADLFAVPSATGDMGQHCDYVWRLPAGAPIHTPCFEHGGRRTVSFHLDKHDPDRGLGNAVKHLVFETPVGPVLALVGAVFVASRLTRAQKGRKQR